MTCEYPDCFKPAYKVLEQTMRDGTKFKTPMCKKHWKGYLKYVKLRVN